MLTSVVLLLVVVAGLCILHLSASSWQHAIKLPAVYLCRESGGAIAPYRSCSSLGP
jgi:hypothetical protein